MFSIMVSFQTLSLGGSIKGVDVNRGEKSLRRPRKGQRGWKTGESGVLEATKGDDPQEQGMSRVRSR